MHSNTRSRATIFGLGGSSTNTALAILLTLLFLTFLILFITFAAQPALGQTFTVLHNFTDGEDGALPFDGLVQDAAGNIYGTAYNGGYWGGDDCSSSGCGVVFKLTRTAAGWQFSTIYAFLGMPDAAFPLGGVVIGPDGNLYGSTQGGGSSGWGSVLQLRPPLHVGAAWTETILHSFSLSSDGFGPWDAVTVDRAGNIYGTTRNGGAGGLGTVFMLTRANGQWEETILHSFTGPDGADPTSSVVLDTLGNVYGTTVGGGAGGGGVIFELSPSPSGWIQTILRSFAFGPFGDDLWAGVTIDSSARLWGVGTGGGGRNAGTAFVLSPSNGSWNLGLLYTFDGRLLGANPYGPPILDGTGNLYGTTQWGASDGGGLGAVYKLTNSAGVWTATSLHQFSGSDGMNPLSNLMLDASGNLYGTTRWGGTGTACQYNCGVIFEIAP
jgi:uncharacterized repeat protein (TIGR03803 family)